MIVLNKVQVMVLDIPRLSGIWIEKCGQKMSNRHHYAGGLKKCTIMLEIDVLWTIGEKWVLSGICIEKCGT